MASKPSSPAPSGAGAGAGAAPSNTPTTEVQMIIGGYDVRFPFKPYASQIGIASRVLKALDTGTNALLESPTGSGKSLALLCAALAWQERWKADREAMEDSDVHEPGTGDVHDGGRDGPETKETEKLSKKEKPEKVPRVYYATRTHSQIAQVVRELKRTTYSPSMTVLGSREHYCVNQKARQNAKKKGAGGLGEECKALLDAGGRGREGTSAFNDDATTAKKPPTTGCSYSHGAIKLTSTVSKSEALLDIEDLVKLGVKTRGCPYFASKNMHETAELIFCPYNYLLDPGVRAAMDVDLNGALVILDEAHNVEDTCREAASCDVHLSELQLAAEEFSRVALEEEEIGELTRRREQHVGPSSAVSTNSSSPLPVSEHALLANVSNALARWLHGASDQDNPRCPLRPHGFERWIAVWSGGENVERQLRDAGVDTDNLEAIERARNFCVKNANDSKTSNNLRVNGMALKTCEKVLTSARYALRGRKGNYENKKSQSSNVNTSSDAYRLAVSKSFDEVNSTRTHQVTLSLWALNPALAFGDLTGPGQDSARSVVLTSGTLAPLESFASELGAPFPIRMEAPHCVDIATQVFAGAVSTGVMNSKLSGTFKTSVEFAYQDDLGASLEQWAREIPHGVLVFFPSYSLLDRVAQRWKATGAWKQIEQNTKKKLFQEPRGSGGGDGGGGGGRGRGRGGKGGRGSASSSNSNSLDDLLSKYYRCVQTSVASAPHAHAAAPATQSCRGAILLAVCRGKVSEGIDFADANARGVIVVGIPYPNLKDKQVELKRKFNDDGARKGTGVLTGDQWYQQQAFRALNQAVGRCLRHRTDHGAVLLVDERYMHGSGNTSLVKNLPKWLRPALRKCVDFDDSVAGLRKFFSERATNPPPEAFELTRVVKLQPSVGNVDRGEQGDPKQAGKSNNKKEKEPDTKQRDIKNFFKATTSTSSVSTKAATTKAALECGGEGFGVVGIDATKDDVSMDATKSDVRVDAPPAGEKSAPWQSAPMPVSFVQSAPQSMPPPTSQAPRDDRAKRSAAVSLPLVMSQLTDPPSAPPFVTLAASRLTDPPSATHTQEVQEMASAHHETPEVSTLHGTPSRAVSAVQPASKMTGAYSRKEKTPATSRPLPADLAEIPDEVFEWGAVDEVSDDKHETHTNTQALSDGEFLSVWGGTPGTQEFGARGCGATQQFRNFAPAPEIFREALPEPLPVRKQPSSVLVPEPGVLEPRMSPEEPEDRVFTKQKTPQAVTHNAPKQVIERKPNIQGKPFGLGFGAVATCGSCLSKSVSTATAFEMSDAIEASATPIRRVCTGTGNVSYLSVLVEANERQTRPNSMRVSSKKLTHVQARLLYQNEPFPLRCAKTVSGGTNDGITQNTSSLIPPPLGVTPEETLNPAGVWSTNDGCYFTPLRCKGRWVGARVEATNPADAFAMVETAPVETDFFDPDDETIDPPRRKKTQIKPGMVFFLEDAILPEREGTRGVGVLQGTEQVVQAMETEDTADPFSTEDNDLFEDENTDSFPNENNGRSTKRRRVRRKGSAEAGRVALQSREDYGHLPQQVLE